MANVANNAPGAATVIGKQESHSFGISKGAEHILVDSMINLYSDPLGSIVREITSNAIDAHRERELKIKGDRPLEEGESLEWFSDKASAYIDLVESNPLLEEDGSIVIQDWGVGLSPERVANCFVNFGDSTKRVSDIEIGGYGLGAKSPFSYTDTFYVETWYNGVYKKYMVFRDKLLPSMTLITTSDTTDKNSTKITIPIKNGDEEEVKDKISEQLSFFSLLEFGPGLSSINKVKILFTHELFHIASFSKFNNLGTDSTKILLGNVLYPMDYSLLGLTFYRNLGVVLRFKIGELKLVPSREAIRYTEDTINTIKERMKEVEKAASEYLEDKLTTTESFKEYLQTYLHLAADKGASGYTSYYSSHSNSALETLGVISKMSAHKISSFTFCKSKYDYPIASADNTQFKNIAVSELQDVNFPGYSIKVGGSRFTKPPWNAIYKEDATFYYLREGEKLRSDVKRELESRTERVILFRPKSDKSIAYTTYGTSHHLNVKLYKKKEVLERIMEEDDSFIHISEIEVSEANKKSPTRLVTDGSVSYKYVSEVDKNGSYAYEMQIGRAPEQDVFNGALIYGTSKDRNSLYAAGWILQKTKPGTSGLHNILMLSTPLAKKAKSLGLTHVDDYLASDDEHLCNFTTAYLMRKDLLEYHGVSFLLEENSKLSYAKYKALRDYEEKYFIDFRRCSEDEEVQRIVTNTMANVRRKKRLNYDKLKLLSSLLRNANGKVLQNIDVRATKKRAKEAKQLLVNNGIKCDITDNCLPGDTLARVPFTIQ